MWKMKPRRSLRVGPSSVLIAGLLLMGFGLRPDAAHALPFDFSLTLAPETVGSWYRPSDGAIKFYNPGTVLTLDLPKSGGTFQSGTARITDFSLPGAVDTLGIYFSFTSVPSVLVGTVVVSGNQAEISFPDVSVDFVRGSNSFNANPGTLVFTLTTAGTTIPAGCADRSEDQVIPGIPLDLTTGALGLVASVCPYYVDDDGIEKEFDNAFRLATRGTVDLTMIPEPGTLALVASGLLGLAIRSRRPTR
jgi:hypothetical protein